MKPTLLFFFAGLFCCCELTAQEKRPPHPVKSLEYISIAVTNSHTAMPFASFSKLFYKDFHPGVEIGTGFDWQKKKKHEWIQSLSIGYSYHAFVQRSLMLYTEFGYRYKFPIGISATTKIGGGYLHSIQDAEVFVLDKNGEYVNAKKGRSHAMASLTFNIAKQINKNGWQIFMAYQQRFQFSFIAAYVPALPVNVMHIGFSIPVNKK